MNEVFDNVTVVSEFKGLGDKMINILDKINFTDPDAGKKELKEYVRETWKKVAWNNELFFIDLSKGKRERYEGSKDLPAMAVAVAYKDRTGCMDGFGVANSVIARALVPLSSNGINIWNVALLSCRSIPDVRENIKEFLIGDEIKATFKKWLDCEKEKAARMEAEIRANMEAAKMENFSKDDKIIDGEFREVPFEEQSDQQKQHEDPKADKKEKPSEEVRQEKAEEKKPEPAKNPKKEELKQEKKPAENKKQDQPKKAEEKPVKTEHPKQETKPDKKDEKKPAETDQRKEETPKKDQEKPPVKEEEKKQEEAKVAEDPAETEHPEDDPPVDAITGTPIVQKKPFPDMKETVLFKDNKDKPESRPNTPFHQLSDEYEKFFPKIGELTDMAAKEGFGLVYHLDSAVYPAGNIITADVVKISEPNKVINHIAIDPDVIYHNGYNVLSMTAAPNGRYANVLNETVVPLSNSTLVMKLIRGTLTRKDRKSLAKMLPRGLRDIYDIVDFSGLKLMEPMGMGDWKSLCVTLTQIIDEQDITKRVQMISYMDPEHFTLIQSPNIRPVSRNMEDYAKILEEGQPECVIDVNPKYKKDPWVGTRGNNKSDSYHIFRYVNGAQVDDWETIK